MVRALIVTYILSGILLAVLSFALFKFRLPEDSKRLLSVLAMCTLSGMAGGMVS